MVRRQWPKTFLVVCTLGIQIATAQKKDLGFNQIFKGEPTGISRALPNIIKWVDDEHYVELGQDDTNGGRFRPVLVDVRTGKSVPYNGTDANQENTRVFLQQDDIFFSSGGEAKKITNTAGKEINPTLSPDRNWVAFTRDNNLFAVELSTGKEIKFTSDGSDVIYNGYASWVYYEEILGRASRYKAFWWSPDSKRICFMRFDDSKVPVFPIYASEGPHGYLENQRYPKAGDKNPEVKVGIVSITNPSIVWCDFNAKDDQYFGEPTWTPANELWVQWMPRSQDVLKLFSIDPTSGGKRVVYSEEQKTWIDLDRNDRIRFLNSPKSFLLSSDKSGWMHLYHYDYDGRLINQVTSGDFTVTGVTRVDEKQKLVYFTARRENSARTDYYKVGLNGKGLTRLTFGDYTHAINPSPTGKYFITTYSNLCTPPKMALVDAQGKRVRELFDSKGKEFENYNIPKIELVRVKSADGLFDLPMTITYPTHFDPTKKYPILISVYGGPNAGTVFDSWKSAIGTSTWWANEGMIQVAMDNRSSGHFGKKGLNYIHRQLGKYEIEDYMECARYLRKLPYADSSKICITGGSFGGYMTCMALTYGAAVFTHGIANSSVTDWKLYDTHYTERFMDTPSENPEGYRLTSVLTHADNYKGLLRIVHGTMDDNVHMQNSIQFIDLLQDKKKHFEFMVYPGQRHGIGSSKGLHNRLEAYRFYYKHLLNKPMPDNFWE